MRRLSRLFLLVLAGLLVAAPARAEVKTVHATLASARAQGNREEIFKLLMTGKTPSWLAGKSSAVIARQTKAIRAAVLEQGRKVVKAIVAKPKGKPGHAEQTILGLLSPTQRAQLLKEEAGFQVERITSKVDGKTEEKVKVTLKRYGQSSYGDANTEFDKQMNIYNRVMGPNVITYMPAGYHSKYVSRGNVFDIWGSDGDGYGAIRPNDYALHPTWLSDAEAQRMSSVINVGRKSWDSSLGKQMAHGRPAMWPPAKGVKGRTGNSCTTTFIRAPVGERASGFGWIDELQASVLKAAKAGRVQIEGADLKTDTVLAAVTGKSKAASDAIFTELTRQLPRERDTIARLQTEVDFFRGKLESKDYSNETHCTFPMDLMHRTPLSELARIASDPVGPKGASRKFRAADPVRVGVLTVFEKEAPVNPVLNSALAAQLRAVAAPRAAARAARADAPRAAAPRADAPRADAPRAGIAAAAPLR